MRFSFWAGTARQGRGSKRATLACGVVALALPFAAAAPAQALTVALSPATSTSAAEPAAGTSLVHFTATPTCDFLESSSTQYTVTLAPTGTFPATAGADYLAAATPATVTVSCTLGIAGAAQPFDVTLNADTLDENPETFNVSLVNGGVAAATTTVTITDDPADGPPTAAVGAPAAAVTEGTGAGTTTMTFPVTLSAPSGRTVQIPYTLAGITATAGTDFNSAAGTVTIPAGSTSGTISVPITRDNVDEPNETLSATLGAPTGGDPTYALAGPSSATATGTISDDDAPVWTISSAKVTEGNSGTTPLSVDVSLSNPSARTLTIHYATADITSDKVAAANRATAGSDYVATNGDLTFAPGETKKTITVTVLGDTAYEADEAFLVVLSGASVGTIGDAGTGAGTGIGTIANDDAAPAGGTGGGGGTVGTPGTVPGGTTTTSTGSKGGDTTEPKVTLGALRFKKPKRLTVSLTCPSNEKTCRVRLTVFTVPSKSSKIKRLRNEIKLGSRVVLVRGGSTASITVNLSARNAKLVKQGRRVKVKAYAVVSDDAGNVGTASVGGTLKG